MSHPKGIIQIRNRDRYKPLVRVKLKLPKEKKPSAERVGLCIVTPPSNFKWVFTAGKKAVSPSGKP